MENCVFLIEFWSKNACKIGVVYTSYLNAFPDEIHRWHNQLQLRHFFWHCCWLSAAAGQQTLLELVAQPVNFSKWGLNLRAKIWFFDQNLTFFDQNLAIFDQILSVKSLYMVAFWWSGQIDLLKRRILIKKRPKNFSPQKKPSFGNF